MSLVKLVPKDKAPPAKRDRAIVVWVALGLALGALAWALVTIAAYVGGAT